ncbi:MAG TPA: hypothetical protein VFL62_06040 [Bradyrhizobium sp.]|uniref:hypothetical protein n=1 Tax=Bradyrhizobium sp. TaxID=376 RepID=UPI002D805035|nr:hypothetical protein [Bradyrhizobium sp.]HET7885770.1 hypothetical protein [Bradyrhizobium sp.]
MAEQSSMHAYLNWTKQRIDEMDATLAAVEQKADQFKADSKVKADQLVAEMKKRRDEFQATVKTQLEAAEATMRANIAQLQSQWPGFEAQVKTYFETVGKHAEQQQAAFRDIAAAQINTWKAAADELQDLAMKLASTKRADLDAALKQMKAGAAEAEAHFQKLKQAGSESWAAMSAALTESRKAFDRANQQAWDALKQATHPKQ